MPRTPKTQTKNDGGGARKPPRAPASATAEPPLKPGEKCPRSGQYRWSGLRYEVTVSKGETMPPPVRGASKDGGWILVDSTKHKSGK